MSLTAALALAACSDAAPGGRESPAEGADAGEQQAPAAPIAFVEEARFGWAELAESTRTLTDRERAYEGAVLGNIRDVAEGPDGRVYVLDMAFQKIVVFSPDGDFERLILGGAGQGPGEFTAPRSMTFGPGGDLWVYDQAAARITRFDTAGDVVTTFPSPAHPMMEIAAHASLLYGTRLVRDSSFMVFAFDTAGRRVAEIATPSAEDLEAYDGASIIPALGPGPDGLILAYPLVGTWTTVTGVRTGPRRGTALYPEAGVERHTDPEHGITTDRKHVQVSGAGQLDDGRVFIRYSWRDDVADRPIYRVAVFDSAGAFLGMAAREFEVPRFSYSPVSGSLYVVEVEPYPQVVKLRIE